MEFRRTLNLSTKSGSAFIFGPRMTCKTTLLNGLPCGLRLDLLDPDESLRMSMTPRLFWERVSVLPPQSLVIVDEVQRVPALLDFVQMGIDKHDHRFLLSGSSARKLKRGSANLLGGRALDLRLHPLTHDEVGESFVLSRALEFGTLPKIQTTLQDGDTSYAIDLLRSYLSTYIRVEIQSEALTRNIGPFQRFLAIAAQANASIIEFANISRDASVPASTVKLYYEILQDTLLGSYLWPWGHSERKKNRPKFYFFDCGVVRSIQNRLNDPPTPYETGFLFETWILNEVMSDRDYRSASHEFSYWRDGIHEIDIIINDGRGPIGAIECKSGSADLSPTTVAAFRRAFPHVPLIVASLRDQAARRVGEVDVLPWSQAVDWYRGL